MSQRIGKLLLLLMLCASIAWLIHQLKLSSPSNTVNQTEYPDVYMKEITTLQTNQQGQLESRYYSPSMIHYQKDNITDITKPDVTIYLVNGNHWHITANQGRAEQGNTVIYLWDNVRAYRPAIPGNPATTILTEKATVYPSEKIAQTHAPVTLIQPGAQVKSIGARVNMQSNKIELFSNARAKYKSPKR